MMKERPVIFHDQKHASINTIREIPWVKSMGELQARFGNTPPDIIKQRFGRIRILSYRDANLPPSVVSYRHARIMADAIKDMLHDPTTVVPLTVVEVGTGSGLVPITISKNLTAEEHERVRMVATDISAKALEVASINMQLNDVNHVALRQRDMLEGVTAEYGKIDVLTCNPPYSQSAQIQQEGTYVPRLALDGGGDGLNFHRKFIPQARFALSDQGILQIQCQKWQIRMCLGLLESYMPRRAKMIIPNRNGGPVSLIAGNYASVKRVENIVQHYGCRAERNF